MKLDYLKSLLHYNPDTGVLMWLGRSRDHFNNERLADNWNKLFAWKDVNESPQVYRNTLTFNGVKYTLSRIAYFMHHGEMHDRVVYIDEDNSNNRITNLRVVDQDGDAITRKISKNNMSGYTGVAWRKDCKRWVAHITVGYKRIHLGYFEDIDDAIAARKDVDSITRNDI